MIIEFVGLPGAGKSTLIRALEEKNLCTPFKLSRFELVAWGIVGALKNPKATLQTFKRIQRGPTPLRTYGLINSLLYPLAAHALRKRRTICIEHGFLQGLLSFPGNPHGLPMPDLIVLMSAGKEERESRLSARGWKPRAEFGSEEATRFARESESLFPKLEKDIQAFGTDRVLKLSGEGSADMNVAILERCITRGGVYHHRPLYNTLKTVAYMLAYAIRTILRIFDRRPEVAVLMYHAIDRTAWKLAITPVEFERQLLHVKDRAVTLDAVIRHAKGEGNLKKNSVALTFDDAYLDFKTNALPILEKYNVPATMFVPTDLTRPINPMRTGLMSWDDMREIQKKGLVTFESHSRTHPHFPKIDAAALKEELEGSAADLARELGRPSTIHAYPYGDKNKEVVEATKAADYEAAFGITEGMINPGDNLFTLKRIQVDKSMNRMLFSARLTRAIQWLK